MATAAELAAWAQGVGFAEPLGSCVGGLFADQHAGRLPADRSELCQWANSTGVRTPDGVWHCADTGEAGVSYQHWWEDTTATTARIRSWIYANPAGALGIAAATWLIFGFGKGSKRRRVRTQRRVRRQRPVSVQP